MHIGSVRIEQITVHENGSAINKRKPFEEFANYAKWMGFAVSIDRQLEMFSGMIQFYVRTRRAQPTGHVDSSQLKN